MKRSTSYYLDDATLATTRRLANAYGMSRTAVVTLGVRLADRVLADVALSSALRDVLDDMRSEAGKEPRP